MLLLLACRAEPDGPVQLGDSDSATTPGSTDTGPPPDLTEALGADASRAGVVTDAAALFGGISAEGRLGDVLVYNDRVRFVIQQPGDSSYYVDYGGQIIDADLVRAAGEPGRDLLDELGFMFGLGLVVEAERVEVVEDGQDGPATVRVSGRAAPMRLISGALESDSIPVEHELAIVIDYVLEPASWTLQVRTTVSNEEDEAVDGTLGMFGIYAQEVADVWREGDGRELVSEEFSWNIAWADRNELAVGLLAERGELGLGSAGLVLDSLAPSLSAFSEEVVIEPGASTSWEVRVGVGPDLATLTGAQLAWQGAATETVGGTVSAGGAALAGARVHVLDADGAYLTGARTGEDGSWTASVAGAASFVATGRGTGMFVDLPAGHAWISPYDAGADAAIASLATGGPVSPFAEGYGLSEASTAGDLVLQAPGVVRVTVADGRPAVARLEFVSADAGADGRLVPDRADGTAALGWIRDGSLDLAVEPGDYSLVVHRGVREEVSVQSVHVDSGGLVEVSAEIATAYVLDGVVVGDPHVHAAPSADGGVPMEDRLLTMAANGIDIHFGTDHDHVADYRPLLAPMGLDAWLRSVVADEVSPVLRGHFNAWPATPTPGAANNGAPRWWFGYEDTCEIFGWMRELVGEDGVISANHPVGSSGLFSNADYDGAGTVETSDHWCQDFSAMEVVNSGDWSDYLPYYLDLSSRGYAVAPVGVSDTHTYTSGGIGFNITFFHTGTSFAEVDDQALVAAVAAGETVASKGPYLDVRIADAWAPGHEVVGPTELAVKVMAPSWMPVTDVTLWENGVAVATESCTGTAPTWCDTSFSVAPAADAAYVVTASSTQPTTWVHAGDYAFAVAAAVRVDAEGDGWTAPLGSLVVE